MLNEEKSKEYEKHLIKKKAELVKYLKGKAVGFEKFASMDEYLCEVKEEEELCDEGDAFRLYESVNIALAGYLNRQSNEFLLESLCIDDANDAIAYMFGKKFKRNKIDLVELIGQLDDGCADFSDSDHYLLSRLNKAYIKFLENKILHIQLLTGHKLIAGEDQFCIKNATINAGGIMIINYQCELEGEIVDKVLWLGAKYLSMSDALLKKRAEQKQNVNTWKY